MDQHYGRVVWTNHALQRLRQRRISQGEALSALKHADSSRYAATKKAYVYYKRYGNEKIEVVAKQNERREWVVLSVWSRPIWGRKREGILRKLWRLLTGF